MTSEYPDYLYPLAVALKWEGQATLEALAESYRLFSETVGDVREPVTISKTADLSFRVLKSLQEKHLILPFNVIPGTKAATVFLESYLDSLQTVWKITSKNEDFLRLASYKVAFMPPRKWDGEQITTAETNVLKTLEKPKFHALPAKENLQHMKQPVDKVDFSKSGRTWASSTENYSTQNRSQYLLKYLLKSPLVKVTYFGHRNRRDSVILWLGSSLGGGFAVYFCLMRGLLEYSNGLFNVLAGLLVILILGCIGMMFGFIITLGLALSFEALAKIIFKKKVFRFLSGKNRVYLHIRLTKQGYALLEEAKAWENFKTHSESNSYRS